MPIDKKRKMTAVFNNKVDKLVERGGKAVDDLSKLTGIWVLVDRLSHPNSDDVITLDVPGYRQANTFSCGVVAGLMVLHTFHPSRSKDRFYRRVDPCPKIGTDTAQLVRALRQSRIGVDVRYDLSWDRVYRNVSNGYPIITVVKTGNEDVEHWVVIYGVGKKPNRVFIAANGYPWIARRDYRWKAFCSLWPPGEKGFGLVCWGE